MINTVKEKWNDIKEHLRKEAEISDISFKTWIVPLTVHNVSNGTIYVLTPDGQLAINHINKKYSLYFKIAVAEILGQEFEIEFIDKAEPVKEANNITNISSDTNIKNKNLLKYTFDTFVKGDNNSHAFNASLAVADSPANAFNPLFLYGGAGLGKTHLMFSIANYIRENNPSLNVLYVTSEEFTNDLIESIRLSKNINKEFREKYRNIDVLLIDDIQFIIGKESTQEEFFHTFNSLYLSNKQIVITSDKPPKEMTILDERFRSRFEQGLTVDIQPPTYETRMAILKKKAEMEGYQRTRYEISDDVFDYIATHIKSNIRELEGALTKIVSFAGISNIQRIDVAFAESALHDIISPDAKREITPELIINIVAEHYGIKKEDILSTKKSHDIAYPRQICMYLCRKLTDVSLKSIGNYLGKKDHSTILHGINKIETDVESNANIANTIDVLIKKISPL